MEINNFWENSYKFRASAQEGEKELGYCEGTFLEGAGEIYYIEVLPGERQKGLGTKLLSCALESCPNGEWSLEVRESNAAAIALYKKFGFMPVSVRKGYYKDPLEDGILMIKR